jgi:branched-chain amino acid aminotransferase
MPDEMAGFDEIFVTGTAAEVTPVSQIDDLRFQVGPIARQMMGDYEALVHRRAAA